MLPGGNTLASAVIASPFLPPKDRTKDLLTDFFLGGNGISDTSGGLSTQVWQASLGPGRRPVIYSSFLSGSVTVFTAAVAIAWLSAGFDQSLNPLVAWTDINGDSWYRWYDTVGSAFVITQLPAGTITPYAILDDARSTSSATNDGMIVYINSGSIKFRQQRDRFATDYTIGTVPAVSPVFGPAQLTQVGMNLNFRLQLMFQYPGLGLTAWPPVLLSDLVGAIPRVWPVLEDSVAHSPKAGIDKL